ncbi:Crp/Fnr family transcriptional regulator [uncultured Algimonas sp.]|uniref:Crp/Fnr family transcriptional regulator n=1 Tax=uncultured Algimonas sp. TaxID=1547920 RepID=UPI002626F210|nr:Crp/Fnr family transcriptional regulator [uncultured Algimonas sp.]
MEASNLDFAFEAFDHNFGLQGEGRTLLQGIELSSTRLKAKQAVHHAGDDVDSLYIVLEGWLTTVMNRVDGQRLLLDFHVPVDLTGLEFLAERRAESSLIAFEPSRIVRIPIEPFAAALARNETASVAVLKTLAGGYIALQRQMSVFAFASAPAKIASFLLGLRDKQRRNGFDDPNVLRLPLTQYDIADALGLSNVTVSRIFTKFGRDKLVTFNRNVITILDPEGLQARTGLIDTPDLEAG